MADENKLTDSEEEVAPLFDLSENFDDEIPVKKEEEPEKPKTVKGVREPRASKEDKPRKNPVNKMAIFLCSLATLGVGIYGGYMIAKNNYQVTDPNVIKIIQAYNVIKEKWLFGKDIEDLDNVLTDMMIQGLLDNGDPYTFYTPTMEDQNLDVDGEGLGISSFNCPEGVYLTDVFTSGSFYKAGARRDDILQSVTQNGTTQSLIGKTSEEVSAILKAVMESEAEYRLLRTKTDGTTEELAITAKKAKYAQDVAELLSDSRDAEGKRVVAIRINTFLGDPFTIVQHILDEKTGESETKGAVDRVVFDLRDNGGGYVNQAVTMAALFAPKGSTLMVVKDKSGEAIETYKQKGNPRYTIPDIRVIMNGRSASASETFALSLIQNNNAKIYGHQSFGKGIVQTFFQFRDGSVIRYTYGQVYAPDGKMSIQGVGIAPDVPSAYTQISSFNYEYSAAEADKYQVTASEQLRYLGFDNADFLTNVRSFQTTYGYPVTGVVDLTFSHQLIYQVYRLDRANKATETAAVVGERTN